MIHLRSDEKEKGLWVLNNHSFIIYSRRLWSSLVVYGVYVVYGCLCRRWLSMSLLVVYGVYGRRWSSLVVYSVYGRLWRLWSSMASSLVIVYGQCRRYRHVVISSLSVCCPRFLIQA
jgi:hypothetical protein